MTRAMKAPVLLVVPMLVISPARAESLSAADREALLEKLDQLRETADSKVSERVRAALAAYRAAAESDQAAIELYHKCVEKVNFQDQQKKSSDFREWKRREAEKSSTDGMGLALRLQLRWLILTLLASSEKTDRSQLLPGVREIVDAVSREAEQLRTQQQILKQAVTASLFAKAYEIGELSPEKWPLAPAHVAQIYEQILLPPLRAPEHLEALRAAWNQRIQQETALQEFWPGAAEPKGNKPDPKGKKPVVTEAAPRGPEYARFIAETVPELQWRMELDLFRCGGQQAAALRMLEHMEKHINHPSARKWGAEFKQLLNPAPPAPPAAP